MARIVAIVQARLGSTRLPGKVMMEVAGRALIVHVMDRVRRIGALTECLVATTLTESDDDLVAFCRKQGWACFRGSDRDVLDRFYRAATAAKADHVMRITADDPLVCPTEATRLVALHQRCAADYSHSLTVWGSGLPIGTGCEVVTMATLEEAWRYGVAAHHREHVTEYIYEHPERFHIERLPTPPNLWRPALRLTVDTERDLALIRRIYARLYAEGATIALADVIDLVEREPRIMGRNDDGR